VLIVCYSWELGDAVYFHGRDRLRDLAFLVRLLTKHVSRTLLTTDYSSIVFELVFNLTATTSSQTRTLSFLSSLFVGRDPPQCFLIRDGATNNLVRWY